MTRDVHEAVALLKKNPEGFVLVEIDGFAVELRIPHRRTVGDIFREAGRIDEESAEEMLRVIRKEREVGGTREAPEF